MKEYAILLDTTFCTGCNACGYRCVQEFRYHEQAAKGLFRTFVQINDDGLYHHRCMHCIDPDCVANCPVKALTKSEFGMVLYDAKKCIGCQTCVRVCKFHVPQFDEAARKIVKCSMCAHRVGLGKEPACVEVCPTGALQFGEYQEILRKAQSLAAEKNLKVYGRQENGGAHVFVVAKNDPATIGYPKVAPKEISKRVSEGETFTVPTAIAAVAIGGFTRFSERRARVEAEEKEKLPKKK